MFWLKLVAVGLFLGGGLWVAALDRMTYELACGIELAADSTYRMLGNEIVKSFEVRLDQVEYLIVGPHKRKKYYISGEWLSLDKIISNEIRQAFALGDHPRLILKTAS